MGFRNKYEFDKKRIIVASNKSIAIIGYDLEEKPHELLNMDIDDHEEIQLVTFIDDENPTYILLITYDFMIKSSVVRILTIK